MRSFLQKLLSMLVATGTSTSAWSKEARVATDMGLPSAASGCDSIHQGRKAPPPKLDSACDASPCHYSCFCVVCFPQFPSMRIVLGSGCQGLGEGLWFILWTLATELIMKVGGINQGTDV